jgi:hypothetical protein
MGELASAVLQALSVMPGQQQPSAYSTLAKGWLLDVLRRSRATDDVDGAVALLDAALWSRPAWPWARLLLSDLLASAPLATLSQGLLDGFGGAL